MGDNELVTDEELENMRFKPTHFCFMCDGGLDSGRAKGCREPHRCDENEDWLIDEDQLKAGVRMARYFLEASQIEPIKLDEPARKIDLKIYLEVIKDLKTFLGEG